MTKSPKLCEGVQSSFIKSWKKTEIIKRKGINSNSSLISLCSLKKKKQHLFFVLHMHQILFFNACRNHLLFHQHVFKFSLILFSRYYSVYAGDVEGHCMCSGNKTLQLSTESHYVVQVSETGIQNKSLTIYLRVS